MCHLGRLETFEVHGGILVNSTARSSHTKDVKMGVVPACMVFTMKWGPLNITGRPGVSIM